MALGGKLNLATAKYEKTPIRYLEYSWQGRQELNPYLRFWRPLY